MFIKINIMFILKLIKVLITIRNSNIINIKEIEVNMMSVKYTKLDGILQARGKTIRFTRNLTDRNSSQIKKK